jgi:hypothetical protein
MKTRLFAAAAFGALLIVLGPARATAEEPDLDKKVEEICRKVEKLRGLKFKRKVTVGVKSRKELRKFILDSFEKEFPEKKARETGRVLKKMGLIPPDCDLRKTFLDLLTSQIGGFYNPETKRLFVIKPGDEGGAASAMMRRVDSFLKMAGTSMNDLVTAHELTHALQDQHYNLLKLQLPIMKNEDRVTALKCLFEGDAVHTQNEYMFSVLPPGVRSMLKAMSRRGMGQGGMEQLSMPGSGLENVPEYLKVGLAYPYIGGPRLVSRLLKDKDISAVDALFKNPPTSTEQVLHLDRLFGGERDEPTRIHIDKLRRLLPDGARELDRNVLGELGTRILLKQFLGAAEAKKAAAGWDGDTYAAFDVKGEIVLVWVTNWDSEEEAREFVSGCSKLLRKKYALGEVGALEDTQEGSGLRFIGCGTESSYNLLVRNGCDVALLEGLPARAARRLGRRIWENVRKEPYKHHALLPMPDSPFGPVLPGKVEAGPFRFIPPGKEFRRTKPAGNLIRFGFRSERLDAEMEGAVLNLGEKLPPAKVAQLIGHGLRGRLEGLRNRGGGPLDAGGKKGFSFAYAGTHPRSKKSMAYRHVVFCRGTRAFVLTLAVGNPDSEEEAGRAFEALVKSVEIGKG